MSALAASSGSFAAIFSLLGSKKWIILDGLTGISSAGSGAPMARGFPNSLGFRTPRTLAERRASGAVDQRIDREVVVETIAGRERPAGIAVQVQPGPGVLPDQPT